MRLLRAPGVFPPHSDSWLLARQLLDERVGANGAILDLCTGSGLLAVLAARKHRAEVVAVDVSRRAVITTQINARLNGLKVKAIRGDLFAPLGRRRFDLIVSNPPYLPTMGGAPGRHSSARAWEAGTSGREYLDRICRGAPAHLHRGGVVLLVHSSVCGEQATLGALEAGGLEPAVVRRERGTLGPRLRARAAWLHEHDLVTDDACEEMIVIRATRTS